MAEENQISYPNIKQSWGIVGIAILIMLGFSPVKVLLDPITGEEASFLIYYLSSMGFTFSIAHSNRKKWMSASDYNFDLSTGKIMVLVSVAIVGLQIGIISPIVSAIPMPEFMEKVFLQFAERNGVFSFIAIVIAAPILEELIFRGVILDGLLKKYSPLKAIIISSILFGVIHLNPWQFISALIIGVFSGWVYYETKKLTLSILIHAVNNLLAFGAMYFTDAEASMNKSLSEHYGGYLNMIMITVGATGVAAVCLYLLMLEFKTSYGSSTENSGYAEDDKIME